MGELSDKLIELGDQALQHQTLLELGIGHLVTDENIRPVLDHMAKLFPISEGFWNAYVNSKISLPLSQAQRESVDYPSYLGLAPLAHDLTTVINAVYNFHYSSSRYLESDKLDTATEKLNKFSIPARHDSSLLVLTLGVYISSGIDIYDRAIDPEHFEETLQGLYLNKKDFSYVTKNRTDLTASDMFLLNQLDINAMNAYHDIRTDRDTSSLNVTATLGTEGKWKTVELSDNGFGISPEDLPKLFGDYTTHGTGIGLQIVKRITDLKGGHIQVTSTKPGNETFMYDSISGKVTKVTQQTQGTTFKLYLKK